METEIGSKVHIRIAGCHGKTLIMSLICQIDRVAVLRRRGTFGERAVLIAGDKQMIDIVTHCLRCIYCSYRFRRISGTAEADQKSRLRAGEICLRRSHDISCSIRFDLMVQKTCQMREKCVSDKFACSRSCQDHIEVITCNYLIDKFLNFILVFCDLPACLLPCRRLLINLSQCKDR